MGVKSSVNVPCNVLKRNKINNCRQGGYRIRLRTPRQHQVTLIKRSIRRACIVLWVGGENSRLPGYELSPSKTIELATKSWIALLFSENIIVINDIKPRNTLFTILMCAFESEIFLLLSV